MWGGPHGLTAQETEQVSLCFQVHTYFCRHNLMVSNHLKQKTAPDPAIRTREHKYT